MQVESCATPLLSEGIVCLPKQGERGRRNDRLFVQSLLPSQISSSRAGKKESTQERESRKETKDQEDQAGPEGTSHRTLDEWLKKDTPLKVILKKQSSSSLRNVYFLFKVEVRNLYKKCEPVKKKTHFLDLTLEEDCARRNTLFALKRREQMKEQTQGHYWRRQELKPRRVRIVTHILKTMLRENTLLGL